MTQYSGTLNTDSLVVQVETFLEELVPEFLEDLKKDVETIMTACGQGDYEAVWTLAHDMKGTGSGYGFEAISDLGRSLERSAVEKNSLKIRALAGALSHYLERVEVVYV